MKKINHLILYFLFVVLMPLKTNASEFSNDIFLHDDFIIKESKKFQINPELIYSIIKIESDFNEKALSPKGAEGLMQLMPFTAKRYGIKDSFDPEQNLSAGIEYFAFLIKRYSDINYAIAAYNAGENAVDKYKGIPPYSETKLYVKKFKIAYKKLTGLTLPNPGHFFISR